MRPGAGPRSLDLAQHMIIPVIVLASSGTAALVRIMRANLLDELYKPYVITARAKGLPEWRLILKYPVRAALNPFVSTIGWTPAGAGLRRHRDRDRPEPADDRARCSCAR